MSVRRNRLDALGDRMKSYERVETSQVFPPNSILYVRLDGRGFSKFTKGLERPYDERMSNLMKATAKYLCKEFNCLIVETQSDEISCILLNSYEAPCMFEGKKQKLISTLASSATAFFNANLYKYLPEKVDSDRLPTFDCRVFPVPTKREAANAILWRERDAIKNSVAMAASHYFSHKELQNKSSTIMIDMLKTKHNIVFEDYPTFFKTGSYFQREVYIKEGEGDFEPVVRSRISEVNLVLSNLTHKQRVEAIFGINTDKED